MCVCVEGGLAGLEVVDSFACLLVGEGGMGDGLVCHVCDSIVDHVTYLLFVMFAILYYISTYIVVLSMCGGQTHL